MTCDRDTTKIHFQQKFFIYLPYPSSSPRRPWLLKPTVSRGRLPPSVPWRYGWFTRSHVGKADVRRRTFRCRRTPWCTSPGENLRRVGPRVLSGGESCSHSQQQSTGAVVQWDLVVGGVLTLVGAIVAVDSSPGEKSGGTTVGWN